MTDNWTKCLGLLPKIGVNSLYNWSHCDRSHDKGYKFFLESYIHDMYIAGKQDCTKVKAKCFASQKKNSDPHDISLKLKPDGDVCEAKCSCKAGSGGKCSHVIALMYNLRDFQARKLHEVPADESKTSKEQQWHKPRNVLHALDSEPIMKCIFAKATTDRHGERVKSPVKARMVDVRTSSLRQPFTESELKNISDSCLEIANDIPVSYMIGSDTGLKSTHYGQFSMGSFLSYQLSDQTGSSNTQLELVTNNIAVAENNSQAVRYTVNFPDLPTVPRFQTQHQTISDKALAILCTTELSLKNAQILEKETVEQFNSDLWFKSRSSRLTSSNFGKVCTRKAAPSASFLKSIFSATKCNAKPLVHGRSNEKAARALYVARMTKEMGHTLQVYDCGLIVNPGCSHLGASPDGKVIDFSAQESQFGILEIKCPYKYRHHSVRAATSYPDFCLELNQANNLPQLKTSHHYYFQIQGQMAISGMTWCDFIVSTSKSLFVQRIPFDDDFWNCMLPKLNNFYFGHALNYLCTTEGTQ